jgi:hypothetical protein
VFRAVLAYLDWKAWVSLIRTNRRNRDALGSDEQWALLFRRDFAGVFARIKAQEDTVC